MGIWGISGKDENYEVNQAKRAEFFNKIAPRGNWKNPIACWIAEEQFEDCNQAAIWFAGCSLTIKRKQGPMLFVVAPGYYNSIGA